MAIDDDNYGADDGVCGFCGSVTAEERSKVKKGVGYLMSHIDSDSVRDAIYGEMADDEN